MKIIRWGLLSILASLVLLLDMGVSLAQTEPTRYFPETGHWVTGDFLRAYEAVPDPEFLYGNPITGAFPTNTIPDDPGSLVQYFERARFELHPENPGELRVVLTLLGELLYEVGGAGERVPTPNLAACRRIPADGFLVCYAFLQFFDTNGGISQFGYPISELEVHEGRLVQYFQRARFEWHPEMRSGQRVQLTDVGRRYFSVVEDTIYLLPDRGDFIPTILNLQAQAYVSRAVMPANGMQSIYVIVQDQSLRPVPGARVTVEIQLPSGSIDAFPMDMTDQYGVSSTSYLIANEPRGTAVVIIRVNVPNLQTEARTSFRIW